MKQQKTLTILLSAATVAITSIPFDALFSAKVGNGERGSGRGPVEQTALTQIAPAPITGKPFQFNAKGEQKPDAKPDKGGGRRDASQ